MTHLIIVQQVVEVLNVPFSTKPGDMKVFATTVLFMIEVALMSASQSPLWIVGGVTELLLEDHHSSPVSNTTEVVGCQHNVSLPQYPGSIFGAALALINVQFQFVKIISIL